MYRRSSGAFMALVVLLVAAGHALGLAATSPAAGTAADALPLGRLPRDVTPTRVGIALEIDPAQPRFTGEVRLDVRVARSTRSVWLHGRNLNITRATITPQGGRPQPLQVTTADVSGVLRLDAARPIASGRARIDIAYDAAFGQLKGAYRVKAADDDYVLTQMEPLGGRDAFPGFDEPGFKHRWNISLTIPSGLQGVANTRLVKTQPARQGWKKLVFATTEPLPSYLIAFAVGPWDIVDAAPLPPNSVRRRALALRGIAPRGQGARMRYMLEQTAAIVAAEEAYFGMAYPYDKLDLLAAPDFGPGAMENAGLVVYRDRLMYADAESEVGLRLEALGTHAHELAHQWFGNAVTMPWWDDLWLKEAFATWLSLKIVDQLQPGRHGERHLLDESLWAMTRDSLASTRRIREPIASSTDIASAFDGITYSKGGAVLAMFERYLGAERFRDGVRRYLRRHARGNATSADLVDALAAASASPAALRSAFASFLDQPGVPLVRFAVDCSGPAAVLKIEQQRFLPVGSTASSAGEWRIPMCVRWGDARGVQSQCALIGGRSSTLPLNSAGCPAWVMPNAGGAGYYRFAMALADAARLEANFDRLDEREQRVYADSVLAAFSAGALDVQGFLRAASKLAGAPARETALSPLGRLQWVLLHLATSAPQQQAVRDFVLQAYGPRLATLGTEPRPGDTDDDRLLRIELIEAIALVGRDPALRAALAAKGLRVLGLQAAGDTSPGDGKLHPDAAALDQRGLALRVAMEQGGVQVFDTLLSHLAQSQDTVVRAQLLGAVSGARQPELQARARELALAPDALRRNEIGLLFGQRDGAGPWPAGEGAARQALRDWIDVHFDTLAARVEPYGASLASIYADGLCSTADAQAMESRFAERLRNLEAGPRTLAQAGERVRLCAALKERQQGNGWRLP